MKIAQISDTHWGARGNSVVFLDYMMTWYKAVFFPTLEEHDITEVIHLGDMFENRTTMDLRTMRYYNEFIQMFYDKGIRLHYIPGNHDIYFRNDNEIISVVELHRAGGKDDTVICYTDPEVVKFGNTKVLMVPWINKKNAEEYMNEIRTSKADGCMGHFEINGFVMHGNHRAESGLEADLFDHFKFVHSGHFHQPSKQKRIRYLGSPFYLNWTDHIDGERGFWIFDTDTMEGEFVRNEYSLFTDIEYNDETRNNIDPTQYENMYVKMYVTECSKRKHLDELLREFSKVSTCEFTVIDTTLVKTDKKVEEQAQEESGHTDADSVGVFHEYIDDYMINKEDNSRVKVKIDELYQVAMKKLEEKESV